MENKHKRKLREQLETALFGIWVADRQRAWSSGSMGHGRTGFAASEKKHVLRLRLKYEKSELVGLRFDEACRF